MIARFHLLLLTATLALGAFACDDDDPSPGDVAGDTTPDVAETGGDPEDDTGDAEGDAPDDAGEVGDLADAGDTADEGDGEGTGGFPIDDPGPITDLRIDGLSAPVEIKYDEFGIPSIRCANDADCAAALGYVHARDRFIQMEIRRRLVRGRLSEIVDVGEPVLEIDVASRTLFSTPDGQPIEEYMLEHASEDTLALLEAYAAGVNAWIDDLRNGENGASLQGEFGFPLIVLEDVEDWTPEDSTASIAALIENLTNDAATDISYGEQWANIQADPDYDETVFADYFTPRPFEDAVIIDDYVYEGTGEKAAITPSRPARLADAAPALREARQTLQRIRALIGAPEDRGSNNWVVGPDLTTSGNALLSNDPHLGLSNPAIWYIAHMDATTEGDGDYHVAGVTFAGLPFVILGHNETIAWGSTNTGLDLSDVYIETLNEDGTGVMFLSGEDLVEVPFVEVEHDFPQANGTVETRTSLFVPHHGPVLSIDTEAGTAVSMRWTGNTMSSDVNVLTELMRASTVLEAREAVRNVTTIGQNWVIIDVDGHYGWFPYNTVPLRPWADEQLPYLPLEGTGEFEWAGFMDYDDLPQAYDREEGYIATANGDFVGALLDGNPANDGHPVLQSYADVGFRQQRIVDLIEATDEHTLETMRQIVGDTYSLVGELVAPVLLSIDRAELSQAAQALYDALEAWAFTCPTGFGDDGQPTSDETEIAEALGCAAFHRVYLDVASGWSSDERAAHGWARSPTTDSYLRALLRPEELENPDLFWDDVDTESTTETRADVIAAAFESAATRFTEQIGADTEGWLWGRVHTTTLRADLFSSFDVTFYDSDPYPKDGGAHTVNVANPSGGASLDNRSGASMRLQCEAPDSGVTCNIQLPGGQPHLRNDPLYLGLVERWLRNEPVQLHFDFEALEADVITGSAPEAP